MNRTILGLIAAALVAVALQRVPAQTPSETVKARGCLQGNGTNENPWSLRGVVLPGPPGVAPAAAPGARGDGGARGAGERAADGGRGGAPAGGRGDGGARGAAPAAPAPAAPAPPPQPPMDLRLAGVDMSPWRNMFVEVEGTLGPRPASGLRELQVTTARSAYGECR